ncbi:MAG: Gfo/Idh/MocA family oxidoreductase [Candidatus Hydrogenedentes bacterium]|nr:Gfo/Idh/MocA family oxidoreductase [Candidatus Hydrogenedentota bacterium]
MHTRRTVSRRAFLAGVAASGASLASSGKASAAGRSAPASERITLAAIGVGSRGRSNLLHFLEQDDVQVVAICDCFRDRRETAKAMVDEHYGNTDCVTYRRHEDVLGRDDIDAVAIATGDRWHAVLSALAAEAGKDIYCEKPFCLTVSEGRALVNTLAQYGTVWQCGTQRRSNATFGRVVNAIHKGMIGNLKAITTSLGGWGGDGIAVPEPEPDPDEFDYDRWLGQAPWAPYSPLRVRLWRNRWDTGAGVIPDMGAHYFDFAQWAHDSEDTGPLTYRGTGVWPDGGFAEVPFTVDVEAQYADGVRLVMQCGKCKEVHFQGDEGWINCTDEGVLTAEPASILRERAASQVSWTFMGGHVRNFLECMRTRRRTVSHPEVAHRAHTIAHCANICLRLGREVQWDPAAERFVGDDDANNLLSRTMRAPWRI